MHHIANLDIRDIAVARKSAAAKPWAIVQAEPLAREDLILLASADRPTDTKAPLARISAPHHMLAQMVAEGKEPTEISAITGYTPARVRTLIHDPAFAELVSFYEGRIVKISANVQAQIQHLALTAGQILQERLEDPNEPWTKKELRELYTQTLDRSGHGPQSKQTININDPSGVINNMSRLLAAEDKGRILSRSAIEAEYSEVSSNVEAPLRDGPETSDTRADRPVAETETERSGGGGPEIPEPGIG